MQKLITAILIIGLLLFAFIFTALFKFDYKTFSKNFLKDINIELSENDIKNVKFTFLPLPIINIPVVDIPNKLHIEDLNIKMLPISLLAFKPKIDHAQAKNVKIYTDNYNGQVGISTHDKVISNLNLTANIFVKNLNLVDYNENTILNIQNFRSNGSNRFSAEFNDLLVQGDISIDNNRNKVNLKLSNDHYNANLEEVYENDKLVQGNGTIVIKSIPYSVGSLYPQLKLGDSKTKIAIAEGVNCQFTIERDNEWLYFKDIKITTPSGNINGIGEIKLANDTSLISSINLNFAKLILGASNFVENSAQKNNDILPNNNKTSVVVTVDEGKIKDEAMSDVKFQGMVNNGQLDIENFVGKFISGGDFNVQGNIVQQDTHNTFNGQINLNHNNFAKFLNLLGFDAKNNTENLPFSYRSDFKLTSVDLFLDNILFKSKDTQIIGNIHSQFIGSIPRVNGRLEVSFIDNSETSPLLTIPVNWLKDILSDMKKDDYLNKFIPIRTITSVGNLDITVNDAVIENTKYDKINLSIGFAPGKVTVNNFFINTGKDYLNASIALDSSAIEPVFNIQVKDGILPLTSLKIQSLVDLRNHLLEKYDLNKINFVLKGFISKLYNDEVNIDTVNFDIMNNNNLIIVNNLSGEIFGGNMSLRGSVLIDTFNCNFVHAINTFDFKKLSKLIPKELYNGESGIFSASGMFSTNGNTLEQLLYNLYTKTGFIAKNIKLKDISIDDFITKLTMNPDDLSDFNNDVQRMLLTGETNFELLQANFEMNRGNIFFKDMHFKSQYSSGTVTGDFNIYKFLLNLKADIDFIYTNRVYRQQPIKIPLTIEGNYFQPAKSTDIKTLKETIQSFQPKEKAN